MEFRRLTDVENGMFAPAMDLYKHSFPHHEQREEASQARIMGEGEYHFDLIFDGDTWVGEILNWESGDFIYVEHFCILPELRNRQYGQRALEVLAGRGKVVILEIDPPVDEVSIHRKGFYERCGYHANDFTHVHPPYHQGMAGHGLVVMSSPRQLSREEYEGFSAYLRETVMGQ